MNTSHDALPRPRYANAHFVTTQIAVGGDLPLSDDLAVRDAAELAELGVTHVLDVRLEADDSDFWDGIPEVTYRWSGIDDAGQQIPHTWFDDVAAWATTALEHPGARLLTHCHMGINRGPSAGYAVMLVHGWDPIDALAVIRAARPIAAVAYAEDALDWWHDRAGADQSQRREDRRRMASWRKANAIDVPRLIAEQRRREEA